jgi:hypothetical protein
VGRDVAGHLRPEPIASETLRFLRSPQSNPPSVVMLARLDVQEEYLSGPADQARQLTKLPRDTFGQPLPNTIAARIGRPQMINYADPA